MALMIVPSIPFKLSLKLFRYEGKEERSDETVRRRGDDPLRLRQLPAGSKCPEQIYSRVDIHL